MALSQPDRAVSVGLGYLRRLGIDWSAHPGDDEVRRQYERVWSRLGSRAIEELFDLPLMTDAGALATLDLLIALMPAAFFTDANLRSLVVLKAVDLSLEWGHSDASCVPYVMFGAIAGARFGDYQAGIRFSNIGIELVERRGLSRVQARTYLNYGNLVLTWTKHLRHARDAFRRAFEVANGSGDVTFAAFSCASLNVNFLAAGDPLSEAQREAEYGVQFAEKAHFALLVDIMMPQLGLIRMLRGLTRRFGAFDDGQFDELAFERRLSADPAFALPESWYWIRKLQARFFSGEYALAVDAASKARRLPWSPPQLFETAEYEFYAALSHASCWDSAPTDQRQQHRLALSAHHGQLEVWAQNCPDNFRDREALVGAEIARIEGRDVDAMRLYDQAISAARASGFVHNEALANELAARYYAGRGFEKIANAYLRDARYGYVRWGADGKVRQLDEMYPHLKEADPARVPAGAIGTSVEHLDLATVIKVSQAISGEIVLERLLDTLMRTAMAQAGAERAVLILASGAGPRIVAEATTSGDTVTVHLRDEPVTATMLPESVLRYTLRSQESVILDDASAQSPIAADPYVRERQARSVLCLPLLNRAKLIGVLYLENNLAPRVFSPARISVLKLLASQAAISLENTHLYRDLAEREAKIRRLVDANIIGIFVSDIQGQVIEANDAFLHMVGYDREDLASGRVNRTNLTPPEWRDRDVRTVEEVKATGTVQPFEKEYFHKNGSRIPILIGVTAFDERRIQVVGFVLDLSERKRAEAEARDSERRYREVQAELAHAGRVATMGQLMLMSAALLLLSLLDVATPPLVASAYMLLLGLGLGMVMQILVMAVQNAVAYEQLGSATSGTTLSRSIGGCLGTALFGGVFTYVLQASIINSVPGAPAALPDPTTIATLSEPMRSTYLALFVNALHPVFRMASLLAFGGFLLSLALKEVPLRTSLRPASMRDALPLPREATSLSELEEIVLRMTATENRWRVYERAAERASIALPPNCLWLLARIAERKRSVAASWLANTLRLDRAELNDWLASLKIAGMIADGQIDTVEVTADGHAAYRRLVDRRKTDLHEMLASWKPDDERPDVRRMLADLAGSFAAAPPVRPVADHERQRER